MNRWFNPSHPQTLQAAVILGYISAVFGLLLGPDRPPSWVPVPILVMVLLIVGVGVGAFGSANNKHWGYFLLAGCAFLVAAFAGLKFADSLGGDLVTTLRLLNASVFPGALAVAALHPHSREYQKIWFE